MAAVNSRPRVEWLRVLRLLVAAVFFSVAAIALGVLLVVLLLGFSAADFFLAVGAAAAAAIGIGIVALPPSPTPTGPPESATAPRLPRRIPSSVEGSETLFAPLERDGINERLEAGLALPERLPAHEYQLRPAVPPPRPAPRET